MRWRAARFARQARHLPYRGGDPPWRLPALHPLRGNGKKGKTLGRASLNNRPAERWLNGLCAHGRSGYSSVSETRCPMPEADKEGERYQADTPEYARRSQSSAYGAQWAFGVKGTF